MKIYLYILMCFVAAAAVGCATTESPNANTGNVNKVTEIDPANLPPGFSSSPIQMSANSTPGIPGPNDAGANKMPNGNIAGIPNTTQAGKTPQTKKTPPIPGIPDDATIRKQMNTPLKDVNIVNNPPKTQTDANNRPPEKRGTPRQP